MLTRPVTGFLCFFVIILFVSSSKAKVLEGELITNENWAFLTRFCFLSKKGRFKFHVEFPTEYEVQRILLYFDDRTQWKAVYRKPKSCLEKESVLSVFRHQFINLTTNGEEQLMANCVRKTKVDRAGGRGGGGEGGGGRGEESGSNDSSPVPAGEQLATSSVWTVCESAREFESSRERWWYIAVSNCDTKKGLRLKYSLEMTNDGGSWLRHFSADQLYILHTDVGFTILYYVLFLASAFTARALECRNLLHETYKLFMVSVLLESAGLTLLTSYYAIFAQYGNANESMKVIGRSFECLSSVTLLLLVMLIAKGYTVTRARLPPDTSRKMAIFISVYTFIYLVLITWEKSVFDPGEVLYVYESPAGYCMIILRLIGWAWFLYSVFHTLSSNPTKAIFFTRFFLAYTLWFVSCPIVVFITSLAIPKWIREKILNGVELTIIFLAHITFYILFQPSSNNFPFHVRTTQIDVMNKEGDGSLDRFTNYAYAPSVPAIVDTSLERCNTPFAYNSHPQLTNSTANDFPKSIAQNILPPSA